MSILRWLALLVSTLALSQSSRADEGMWTVNNFPRVLVKDTYGFEATTKWLEHLQLSSVRFGSGGSGSFVSPKGLVLTNHHVGADCIAKLGQRDRDYHRDGFYAKTTAEALRCPGLEVNVLLAVEDVSAEVRGKDAGTGIDVAATTARKERISNIEKRCSDENAGARCDVVTLYRGGRYDLYRYKRYTDVRLVFSPEFAIAFFGGDADNFTYPRYDLDMALFRVYENDKAVTPARYLRWSAAGAREDELVFTSGHPGSTMRLATVSMSQMLREVSFPLALEELTRQRELLATFAKLGGEAERSSRKLAFSVDNAFKAYTGYLGGLNDAALFGRRVEAEASLKQRLAKKNDADLMASWSVIEGAMKVASQIAWRLYLVEGRRPLAANDANPFGAQTFGFAKTLVRLVDEQDKPSEKRLREYGDAGRTALELALYSPAPINLDLEETLLASALQRLTAKLGARDPLVKIALAGKPAAVRATDLVRGSRLSDVATRRSLAGSRAAQDLAKDPMIAFARSLDREARALRQRYGDEVEGPVELALGRIARAQLALAGDSLAPDATGTLRISFGKVAGYIDNDRPVPPMTVLAGMFGKSRKANDQPPWQIPKSWVDAKPKLKPLMPMNLVSTNDIIGGNSGSPLVNAGGEVVGLIFDGNIQSLVNDFVYRGSVDRAVSVHSVAIIEALRKVYDAGALADEIVGRKAQD